MYIVNNVCQYVSVADEPLCCGTAVWIWCHTVKQSFSPASSGTLSTTSLYAGNSLSFSMTDFCRPTATQIDTFVEAYTPNEQESPPECMLTPEGRWPRAGWGYEEGHPFPPDIGSGERCKLSSGDRKHILERSERIRKQKISWGQGEFPQPVWAQVVSISLCTRLYVFGDVIYQRSRRR